MKEYIKGFVKYNSGGLYLYLFFMFHFLLHSDITALFFGSCFLIISIFGMLFTFFCKLCDFLVDKFYDFLRGVLYDDQSVS